MNSLKPKPSANVPSDSMAPNDANSSEPTLTDLVPPFREQTSDEFRDEHTTETVESVVVIKSRRIDEKIQRARERLAQLSGEGRERRLLHAAIVRRDETLLDELLAAQP